MHFGKRANLLINYPEIIEISHRKAKQTLAGQASLFGEVEEKAHDFSPKRC